MIAVCSALEMGLFLHVAGSVNPTVSASAADRSKLHCDGVNNQSYVCESGHCCGESQCCSYYYELWWFWLVWAIIFILSCCCVCHHRRTKHRLQQQQRQHEINLIAYREAHNYTSLPFYFRFLPNYLLPDYEEVVDRPPTPPPPYSALHTGPVSSPTASSPLAAEQQEGHRPALQPATAAPASEEPCSRDEHLGFPSLAARERLATEGAERGADLSRKDPVLRDLGVSDVGAVSEDKDGPPGGRRRRFTGDSGIEVCVCGTRGSAGPEGRGAKGLRELESLLGPEEEEEGDKGKDEGEISDFCDSCGQQPPCSSDEDALGEAESRLPREQPVAAPASPRTSCLFLHTVNEVGHHYGNTEPQG